jgi:NADH-quinone oxidoreductase subunit J
MMLVSLSVLHVIFYVFAASAFCSALFVVSTRNPVHGVLALVLTFFSMAGIWMLLRAEFLSLILLLVYVGAVMTLFLFVVMMLNVHQEDKQSGFVRYFPFGFLLIVLLSGLLLMTVSSPYFSHPLPSVEAADYSNIKVLAALLYTEYAYPFEIAGVLLLTAMIAAISLAYQVPKRRKIQHATQQITVTKKDRLRLIKIAKTPKAGGV